MACAPHTSLARQLGTIRLASFVNDETAKVTDQGVLPHWLVTNVAGDGLAKRVASKLVCE